MRASQVGRLAAPLIALLLLVACGRNPGTATAPQSLPVLHSAANLASVPWTLQQLDRNSNVLTLSYSYGGCRSIPSGVTVTQTGNNVVVALMAPLDTGSGVCTPVLRVGTSSVRLPALNGRDVVHASTTS